MAGLCDGRVVIITGAGRGIGRAHALAFGREGAKVVVNDLGAALDGSGNSTSPAGEVVDEIRAAGGQAIANGEDIADFAGGGRLVKAAMEAFGRLDVVVNNAHTVVPGRVLAIREEDLEVVWSTGFLGMCNVLHAARPHLRRGASVINIVSSVMLKQDTSGFALYAATKTAIRSLTRTLAVEWGRDGIRVNALSPQTTSPAWVAWAAANPAAADVIRREIPLGYIGEAEGDVGPVAVFLASDASQYMTGGLLLADGGRGHLR